MRYFASLWPQTRMTVLEAGSCDLLPVDEPARGGRKALGWLPDEDADARAIRIKLAIEQGAIASAEELAREGPNDNPRLTLMRGELALRGNNPRQAAEYFRAVLQSQPEDRDAMQGLGLRLGSWVIPGETGTVSSPPARTS